MSVRRDLATGLLACVCIALVSCDRPARTGAVLITIDTLRADHVGAFTDSESRTPHIDSFARSGTVFERASSPLPLTRPSHFSMLTGQYPREHGVLNNATALPESAETLQETLRAKGWRTAAFTATRILGADSGAAQGFEHFEATGKRLQRSGDEVVEGALSWLDGLRPEEPFFLWIHLYEPHTPYAPPPAFRDALEADPMERFPELSWDDFKRIARRNDGDVPTPILEHARRLYRAEVSTADAMVGRFLAGLEARTALDGLLVILTADHGECFENGVWFEHSDCLYDGALRVPLVVRSPKDFAPGGRVEEPVSVLDVAPTVLRSVGLPPPPGSSGRPLQEAAGAGPRHLLVQHPSYPDKTVRERRRRAQPIRSVAGQPIRSVDIAKPWFGVIGPRWKLLVQDGAEELYPAAPVADESVNRASTEPAALDEMRRRLAEALQAHPLHEAALGEVSDELREALEALGYTH